MTEKQKAMAKLVSKLKSVRKEEGLTQEELAEILGVSRKTISRWETGDHKLKNTEKIYAVLSFLSQEDEIIYLRLGNGIFLDTITDSVWFTAKIDKKRKVEYAGSLSRESRETFKVRR